MTMFVLPVSTGSRQVRLTKFDGANTQAAGYSLNHRSALAVDPLLLAVESSVTTNPSPSAG